MDLSGLFRIFLGLLVGFLFGFIVVWTLASSQSFCSEKSSFYAPQIRRELNRLKLGMATRESLYVAVVTSGHFLHSRAKTVSSTWGHLAPALEYYVGEGNDSGSQLSVVSLPGIDDSYPPQKKVYHMYKYLYNNYINHYQWFLRADDDVYVRVPELIHFLSKLDPSQPLYIGSPGSGKKKDLKRLKLRRSERYCMGGPGVVLSRGLLMKLGPVLDDCLKNVVVSYNEDVEVGRCISHRLGIQCTKSFEMTKLFYQDYSNGKMFDSNDSLVELDTKKRAELNHVLTFHPLKSERKMLSIHRYFTELHIGKLKTRISELSNN